MNIDIAPILEAPVPAAAGRRIAFRTRGRRHGPIVRLASPSDVGQLVKPFIFLDAVDVPGDRAPAFGWHPHSGIATLTLLLEGGFGYEDSTGQSGTMTTGAVEWMQAGGGVWHTGKGLGGRIRGYQLWVALPPALEIAPPVSQYLDADRFQSAGPARVILGEWHGASSPIASVRNLNYLDVRLAAGETWTYDPPAGHDVAWLAMHQGRATTPAPVAAGELVVFEESNAPITLHADEATALVLGSAPKHPYPLVMGDYSVHTTQAALDQGEARIVQIAADLRRAGKL